MAVNWMQETVNSPDMGILVHEGQRMDGARATFNQRSLTGNGA
jgi:hypothetical protein